MNLWIKTLNVIKNLQFNLFLFDTDTILYLLLIF
jgi:hypothetical protein